VGTPICVCVLRKDRAAEVVHALGRISSIKTSNGLEIDSAKKGVVSIKVRALYIYLEYNFEVRSL
jgi:translation initiation factor 5B